MCSVRECLGEGRESSARHNLSMNVVAVDGLTQAGDSLLALLNLVVARQRRLAVSVAQVVGDSWYGRRMYEGDKC